jgi:hypothetical protein
MNCFPGEYDGEAAYIELTIETKTTIGKKILAGIRTFMDGQKWPNVIESVITISDGTLKLKLYKPIAGA